LKAIYQLLCAIAALVLGSTACHHTHGPPPENPSTPLLNSGTQINLLPLPENSGPIPSSPVIALPLTADGGQFTASLNSIPEGAYAIVPEEGTRSGVPAILIESNGYRIRKNGPLIPFTQELKIELFPTFILEVMVSNDNGQPVDGTFWLTSQRDDRMIPVQSGNAIIEDLGLGSMRIVFRPDGDDFQPVIQTLSIDSGDLNAQRNYRLSLNVERSVSPRVEFGGPSITPMGPQTLWIQFQPASTSVTGDSQFASSGSPESFTIQLSENERLPPEAFHQPGIYTFRWVRKGSVGTASSHSLNELKRLNILTLNTPQAASFMTLNVLDQDGIPVSGKDFKVTYQGPGMATQTMKSNGEGKLSIEEWDSQYFSATVEPVIEQSTSPEVLINPYPGQTITVSPVNLDTRVQIRVEGTVSPDAEWEAYFRIEATPEATRDDWGAANFLRELQPVTRLNPTGGPVSVRSLDRFNFDQNQVRLTLFWALRPVASWTLREYLQIDPNTPEIVTVKPQNLEQLQGMLQGVDTSKRWFLLEGEGRFPELTGFHLGKDNLFEESVYDLIFSYEPNQDFFLTTFSDISRLTGISETGDLVVFDASLSSNNLVLSPAMEYSAGSLVLSGSVEKIAILSDFYQIPSNGFVSIQYWSENTFDTELNQTTLTFELPSEIPFAVVPLDANYAPVDPDLDLKDTLIELTAGESKTINF